MTQKKFAVVLAGCGVYDGAEIHEATISMLEIRKQGGVYELFAPDVAQAHVINHLTGEVMPESRNVLVEAARIARGNIKPLSEFNAKTLLKVFAASEYPRRIWCRKEFKHFRLRWTENDSQ